MSQGGYPPLKPPTWGGREQKNWKKILQKKFAKKIFPNFFLLFLLSITPSGGFQGGVPPLTHINESYTYRYL